MLGHIWPLFLEANAAPDPRTPHSPDGFPRARARGMSRGRGLSL